MANWGWSTSGSTTDAGSGFPKIPGWICPSCGKVVGIGEACDCAPSALDSDATDNVTAPDIDLEAWDALSDEALVKMTLTDEIGYPHVDASYGEMAEDGDG